MTILAVQNLGHAFGATELFHDISVTLGARDRVALVGPNGVGKTTLLLILAGLQDPSAGLVERSPDLTLGYLRQEAVLTFAGRENTVYEEMLTVFNDLRAQETSLRQMEAAMAADYSAELLAAYGVAQETYELSGGYQYLIEINRVLQGLGFGPDEWSTPLLRLSGGQKTRVLLGRLLLEKPALLILDEPTNHLDMTAIEWLEGTLRRWEGALILVSHDRYFLDRVANRVWELAPAGGDSPAKLTSYRGNYSAYVRQRDEALDRAQKLFEEEKERLAKEVEFIRRHIAGGQGDIAKGRLRQLTRDLALIDQVGLVAMAEMRRSNANWLTVGARARTLTVNEVEERIRSLTPPGRRTARLTIRLESLARSSRVVVRARRAVVGYPDRPLITIDDIKLQRGERVALLGPNGSGKSTLLKTILAEIPPLEGDITLGEDVEIGYFAQAHDQLVVARRVIDELWARQNLSETEARGYLARYLFQGDDVFKLVGDLSGGERGRLALALLALEGANFLLLDEPTNHLDIPSQEILQQVLEAYTGTILLVSHDRYLVDRLAQEIWSIEENALRVYPAGYQEYLARLEGQVTDAEVTATMDIEAASVPEVAPKEARGYPGASPVMTSSWNKRDRRLDGRRRREIEDALEDAEYQLTQIADSMEIAQNSGDEVRLAGLMADYAAVQETIDSLMNEWGLLA
jgi:ATP-binding cassette subfamily F protein 3